MFKKNKTKTSIFEEKYIIDGLYVAEMSIKISSGTVHSRETILCTCKKDSLGHPIYTDILTKNKYRLLDDFHAERGENIVFNPRSFTSVLKNGEYKDNLLKQGYLTKNQAIGLYNALNDGIGYIISKQDEDKKIVADSCTILNDKNFRHEPGLHLEEELEKLMISLALNKKIALIVGNPGSGTTTLVEELAYLIKEKKCPEFLLEKNILEINLPSLQRKINKKNTLEERIKAVIDSAKKNNAIIFIDQADEITVPISEENQNVLAMLRYEAERNGLKIIVTSTKKNFEDYQNNPEFKKQYEIINIHKYDDKELKDIISNHISNQSQDNKIEIDNNNISTIVEILLKATSNNNTLMPTTLENPGLVVSTIERSFAICKAKKEKELNTAHIIKALSETSQINTKKLELAKKELEEIKTQETPKLLRK